MNSVYYSSHSIPETNKKVLQNHLREKVKRAKIFIKEWNYVYLISHWISVPVLVYVFNSVTFSKIILFQLWTCNKALVICLFPEKGAGRMKPQTCLRTCVTWHSGECWWPVWILTKNGNGANVKAALSLSWNCMIQVEPRWVLFLSWSLILPIASTFLSVSPSFCLSFLLSLISFFLIFSSISVLESWNLMTLRAYHFSWLFFKRWILNLELNGGHW